MKRSRHSVDKKMRPREWDAASAAGCNSGAAGTIEAELRSDGPEGFDAKGDVVVEWNAEFLGAVVDVVTTDAAGEGFVLKLLFHRSGFDFVNAFRRLDEGTRGKETGQFIAREKSAIERRDARNAGIAGMAKDRVNDFLGVTAL